jgi:hypothetical protein
VRCSEEKAGKERRTAIKVASAPILSAAEQNRALSRCWRNLAHVATAVARSSGAEKAELQREIVELSLRTLGKLQSVDSVMTFIPPASAKRLVYLTRGDLATLPRGRRATGALIGAHTFAVQSISALPDGSTYLAATPGS